MILDWGGVIGVTDWQPVNNAARRSMMMTNGLMYFMIFLRSDNDLILYSVFYEFAIRNSKNMI